MNSYNITVQGKLYKTFTSNTGYNLMSVHTDVMTAINSGLVTGYDNTKPSNIQVTPGTSANTANTANTTTGKSNNGNAYGKDK